jgi:ABC-type branched-subunit amino acid transport system ATPase component
MSTMTNILETKSLSISFGNLKAVSDVSMNVAAGSITALIGPNGAGKTTLFGLLSGFLAPTAGSVTFNGHDVTGMLPYRMCRLGLARTFQIAMPFASQTVRENIAVGAHLHEKKRGAALEFADAIAERVGLTDQIGKSASSLTVGGRKRLELARALATRPTLLLLDEVLAGLNPQEVAGMIPVIRGICADGVTVLMIEHVMQAVMNLASHVWVLASGQLIANGPPGQVTRDPHVIEAYLGHGMAARIAQMGRDEVSHV